MLYSFVKEDGFQNGYRENENNPLHIEFISDFASEQQDKGEERISNVPGKFLKTYNPHIVVSWP